MEPIVRSDKWVVDGVYRNKLGDLVLEHADVVVWLDLPVRVWLSRLVWRTARRIATREELWNGNREELRYVFHPGTRSSCTRFATIAIDDVGTPSSSRASPSCAFVRRPRSMPSSATPRGARPELGEPGSRAQPEPDRCQEHVEDEVAEEHEEPPERQPAKRDPPLLAQVARAPWRRPERVRERRLAREPPGEPYRLGGGASSLMTELSRAAGARRAG